MNRRYYAWLLCGSLLLYMPSYALAEDLVLPVKLQKPDKLESIPAGQKIVPVAGELTLDVAIRWALASSPRLQSSDATRRASEGERRQAGALPNPEIEVMVENIGGKNQYRGFDSAEVTYGVSQTIEIGGKRSSRIVLAERGMDISNYDYQTTQLDIIREVTQAFVEAVAANEEVKLAEEQQKLAGEVLETVTKRVSAARESLIQKSKAKVALSTSRIALDKARREYQTARHLLASLMGEASTVRLNASAFYTVVEPAYAKDELANNPDIARWKPALAKSEAAFDLEKANAVPDPRVSAGFRDFRETGNKAFVVGLSIPLPVFNSNQGNIAKARAELSRTASDQKASEMTLDQEFMKNLEAQRTAYVQAKTLKNAILPEAEKAFSLSRRGYQEGKFTYLEVLDAERTLADARVQYIEALKEYHLQRAAIERLTGAHLNTFIGENHDQK